MEFVHRPYQPGETIAAIATPPGEGGIAVIRISGDEAIEVAARVFSGPVESYVSHTAHFGKILGEKKEVIDEGLILVMRAPRSYTGENTVEIHCHGGSLITKKVLDAVLKAGARAALPGEFSCRAFINGKLDLAQAEAVQQLIGAKNELALNFAEQQLQGNLSRAILEFQKELIEIAAILEAWVDFPEEGLEFASMETIIDRLETCAKKMEQLCDSFHDGKIAHEGLNLCLIGAPNVGKSSLMNALLGKERAIVTDIPGTTRDVLEEELRLGNLHFRLIDTAGIRETSEIIESEGIKRTKQAMEKADLILLVLDASRHLTDEEQLLLNTSPPQKTLVVRNKIDLPCITNLGFGVSAKTREGLSLLQTKIEEIIWRDGLPPKDEIIITNLRHKQALSQALVACTAVINGLKNNVSPEFVSSDMRKTLLELGTIIGTNITEDILTAIFSKFCIGK